VTGGNRRSRGRRSGTAFSIVALTGVVLLVIGGLVATLDFGGGDDPDTDNPAVQITPGAEVSQLQTQVAQHPDDLASVRVLAEVLANSGRIPESIPWFERAIAAQPEDADLRVAFGRALLRLGSGFDAELQLRAATELDPESAVAAYYLAQAYEASDPARRADAIHWYERVIEIDSESFLASDARARLEALGVASPTAAP
jgi:tetratricopeptide (TPR) repeat protein